MPVFIIPAAFIAGSALLGGTGVALGKKGVDDMIEARRLVEAADAAYQRQVKVTQAQYERAEGALGRWGHRKHEIYDDQLRRFVAAFDTLGAAELTDLTDAGELRDLIQALEVKHIDFEMLDAARMILAGGGTAAASYAIAWGAVGTFASASTGTAISSLTGAAASNAILAWFGGGALSAGGLGAGVGGAVLSGAAAGPAAIVIGAVLKKKGANALREAKGQKAKLDVVTREARSWSAAYQLLDRLAHDYLTVADRMANTFESQLRQVEALATGGLRLDELDHDDLSTVTVAANTAVILKGLLDTPLVDGQSGRPRPGARRHVNHVKSDRGL
jgi:hypothetical protein